MTGPPPIFVQILEGGPVIQEPFWVVETEQTLQQILQSNPFSPAELLITMVLLAMGDPIWWNDSHSLRDSLHGSFSHTQRRNHGERQWYISVSIALKLWKGSDFTNQPTKETITCHALCLQGNWNTFNIIFGPDCDPKTSRLASNCSFWQHFQECMDKTDALKISKLYLKFCSFYIKYMFIFKCSFTVSQMYMYYYFVLHVQFRHYHLRVNTMHWTNDRNY